MDPLHIQSFVERPRESVERLKREYWPQRLHDGSRYATLNIGHSLFQHARLVRRGFPSEEERAADLSHHIELNRLLDLVADALAVSRSSSRTL